MTPRGVTADRRRPVPREIEINEIRELLDGGAQLVDVLPRPEYEEEQLAGAINISLKQMTEEPLP